MEAYNTLNAWRTVSFHKARKQPASFNVICAVEGQWRKPTSLPHRQIQIRHNHILIYIQQDATLHSLFYLKTDLHVSDGTITHHQKRIQLYLQHPVFVTPLLLSAAIVEELELV